MQPLNRYLPSAHKAELSAIHTEFTRLLVFNKTGIIFSFWKVFLEVEAFLHLQFELERLSTEAE